jgi:hypothetical protein
MEMIGNVAVFKPNAVVEIIADGRYCAMRRCSKGP